MGDAPDLSDAALVEAVLGGNTQAFEQIIIRYQRLVFSIIYHYLGNREDVEDLAQDVFLKAFAALARFDAGRSLKAWLSAIAANCCLDHLRRTRNRRTTLFADLGDEERKLIDRLSEVSTSAKALTEAEARRSFELLREAIERLAEKERMAFILREVEGLDYAEVAQALNTSQTAARIRVSRARRKLYDMLEGKLTDG